MTGVIYAGTGSAGPALNQLSGPTGLFFNANDTLYIADSNNCRVLSYLPNAKNGTIVAGTGACGTALNRLSGGIRFIYVDASENIYVTDKNNDRVTQWASGGSTGVLVAGNGTSGSSLRQLNSPYGVVVDASGNVYVPDYSNHRVIKWAPGASAGVVVAGVTGSSGKSSERETDLVY